MYETGVAVALILWVFYSVLLIVSLHSTLARNMGRVGLRLSWANLTPKEISAPDVNRSVVMTAVKVGLFVVSGLVGALFSWVTVAVQIGSFIYARMKDSGAPQTIKDYRWKMKNREMSFDEIVVEIMKITDQPSESFTDVREQMLQELAGRGVLRY
jgi:hypothetical protein